MGYKPLIFLLLVIAAAPALAQASFDPLNLGVGARALGMGKACVAVAEEGDTIFTNPAGLGEIDSFKFTSMSGKVLEDINYTMLGGVYPFGEKTAVGIGYVGAGITGIEIRDADKNLTGRSDFTSGVLFASLGRKFTEKFSVGINLKYYFQQGTDVSSGNESGMNLDIGMLQKGLGWFCVGIVGQNLLSSQSTQFDNGEENLPRIIKIGTRMFILGQCFESALISPLELTAVTDAELNLSGAKPVAFHFGLEFSPRQYLTLRTGIDQDPKPGGLQNNLTAGASLKYAGIGFHYAYHFYGDLAQNATHYFSLTFDERGWPFTGPPEVFMGMN